MIAPVNVSQNYFDKRLPEIIDFIQELVECESPSDSPEHVNRFVELLINKTRDIAAATKIPAAGFGDHLRLEFATGSREKGAGQILGLGHSDTVWPAGTLQEMPFRQADGRLWGPGSLDMKAGLAFFIFAVRALIEQRIPVRRRVVLLVVSDEEVGSPSSRAITEAEAVKSHCVLVLEPGTGLDGKLKTARKGIANYQVIVSGRASHAGVDFENGASAVVEAARQVATIAAMTDLKRGTTVNPGVIRGGTRSNVVASQTCIEVDVRVRTLEDWHAIDAGLRGLQPYDDRCSIEVKGGMNRPPMVRSDAIVALYQHAKQIASTIGVHLDESETGGGSDGNFTAAMGIPTLDGLGAVGEGAHSRNESILVTHIMDRLQLLSELLSNL